MAAPLYSLIGFLALVIHIILNLRKFSKPETGARSIEYRRFAIIVFIFYIADIAWGFLYNAQNPILMYVETVIYTALMAFSSVFFFRYIVAFLHLERRMTRIINFLVFLFGLGTVTTLIVNHFNHIMFWYDWQGNYLVGPYRHYLMGIEALLFIVIAACTFFAALTSKDLPGHRHTAILLFGLTVIASIILQILNPYIPCYSMGLCIGFLIIHVFVHEEELNDKLLQIEQLNSELKAEHVHITRVNEELDKARQDADMANRSKSTFLFSMSHDIRTPMNAILGFSDLIEKNKENPDKISDYLTKLKGSGNYLLSLINNVLDLARIESGKETLDEQFLDIGDVKGSVVPVIEELVRKKNLHMSDSVIVQHPYVMVDKVKVQQITMNLLSNAVKYTPEDGHITCTMHEEPCAKPGYGTYVLTVTDDGIGMSPEFVERIFDDFSREYNTTECKIIGTGLGMSIVKKLVDLMEGTIEVKSELGKGSTFIVTFQHKIVENPEAFLKQRTDVESQGVSVEGKRILLAEDNELNAEIATTLLEDAGVLVEHACDGLECIKMLTEQTCDYYDLILMDVQMPNLDGYAATRSIRELDDPIRSNIPIIAMTANAFEEDKKRALSSGMNGHLTKPIDVQKLMEAILQLV